MEDGCSKRFEIGMLEADEYDDLASTKMSVVPKPRDVHSMGTALRPPMSTNPIVASVDNGRGLAISGNALASRVDHWR